MLSTIHFDLATYMAERGCNHSWPSTGSDVRVEAGAELRRTGDLLVDALDLSS